MAVLTSAKVAAGVTRRAEPGGVLSVASSFTTTAALVAGDTIQMVKIPNGAVILNVILAVDQIDSSGTPTSSLGVGDSGSTSRFIAASIIGRTGGVAQIGVAAGSQFVYTSDTTIDVICTTASATSVNGVVRVTVVYMMET